MIKHNFFLKKVKSKDGAILVLEVKKAKRFDFQTIN